MKISFIITAITPISKMPIPVALMMFFSWSRVGFFDALITLFDCRTNSENLLIIITVLCFNNITKDLKMCLWSLFYVVKSKVDGS